MAEPAGAETLQDALLSAYHSNPQLQAERARLRVTDETYVQTLAQFGPTVSLQVEGRYDRTYLSKSQRAAARPNNPELLNYAEQNNYVGQLVVSQPIYTGGRLTADVESADAEVEGERQALRTVEANVLYATILAYADLLRDQSELDIRQLNFDMLQHQLAEASARQRAGEITRTDVAQAEAQLAAEQAFFQAAAGQIEIDRANFAAVVGHEPGRLAALPELLGVPETLDKALLIADRDNPDLLQAQFVERASHARIYAARSAQAPQASLQLQSGAQGPLVPFDNRDLSRGLTAMLSINVPLYSGGMARSEVRQAIDQNTADTMSVDNVRRNVVRNLSASWVQRQVAVQAVDTQTRQVEAAKIAFEGMRKEYTAGERSTLDVLVAEETLRDAELAQIAARHDDYVAKAAVLQTMGLLEMHNLAMTDNLYRPEDHLRAISQASRFLEKPFEALDRLGASRLSEPSLPSH